MKSKLWIIPILALCLIACLAFTSCGDNGGDVDQGPTAALDVKYVAAADSVPAHYDVIGIVEGDDNEKLVIPDTMKYSYEVEEPVLDAEGNPMEDDAGNPVTTTVTKTEDVPVTGIVSRAFYNNSNITSVVIGNNVTSIGDRAFDSCKSVKSVTLGTGISAIAEKAFFACSSLTSIEIPKEITTVGVSAFEGCTSLGAVTFSGEGLTTISTRAFYGCSAITEFKIPASVSNIDIEAFELCEGLLKRESTVVDGEREYTDSVTYVDTWIVGWDKEFATSNNVVIKEGTVGIAALAFESDALHPIDTITFPSTMEYAVDSAFLGCQIVEAIAPATVFKVVPLETLKLAIVDGGREIVPGTFQGAPKLEGVEIKGNITVIGASAFAGCRKLTEVKIASGTAIKEIHDSAFKDCTSITSFDATSAIKKIEASAFQGCTALSTINIYNVQNIGDAAFAFCHSFETFKLPESATALGESVFFNCNALKEVTLPSGISKIPAHFFHGCEVLDTVSIPAGVSEIGEYAFSECDSLTAVEIPDGVSSIGDAVFAGCDALVTVNIPAAVTKIGSYSFYKCTSLAAIEIPTSCEKIGTSAFEGCEILTTVVIPESVTAIGNYAFYECPLLATVTLSGAITSVGKQIFGGCEAITYTESEGGFYLGNTANAHLMLIKIDENTFTGINAATKIIASGAFEGAKITSIDIPASVTVIGDEAFKYCTSLTALSLPEGLVTLGNGAFYGCASIDKISIPASLKSLSNYAFSGCSALTEITLNGDISIGRFTFEGCTGISELVLLNTVNHIDDYAFSGCSNLWSIEISAVKSIGSYAFFGAQIKKATLPAEAFSGIDMNFLETAVITEGVLGKEVFAGCVTLKDVEIRDAVTSVDSTAFKGCDGVLEVVDGVVYVDSWVVDFNGKVDMEKINTLPYVTVVIREGTVGLSSTAFAMTSTNGIYYSAAIRHITIPESVKYYSSTTFDRAYVKGATVAGNMLGYVIPGVDGGNATKVKAAFEVSRLEYLTVTSGEIIDGALKDVKKLISVTLGEGVTAIGKDAFKGCDKLVEVCNLSAIDLNNSEVENGGITKNAKNVYGADGESIITVTEDKLAYIKTGGKTYVIAYLGDENDLKLPAKLGGEFYDVYKYAFYDYQNIFTVTVEAGCDMEIGESAFEESVYISSVTLGSGVKSIDSNAFRGSTGLTYVYLPKTLTFIGNNAFPNQSSAKSLRLCYEGTANEFADVAGVNANVKRVAYYFSSAKPTTEGQYWHYDSKGAIAIWPAVK